MDRANAYVEAGQRTGTRIFHADDGFYYYADNNPERHRTVYLRCFRRYLMGCRGRAILTEGNELDQTAEHCHLPDPLRALELQLRRNILVRCRRREYHPYHTILEEERSA